MTPELWSTVLNSLLVALAGVAISIGLGLPAALALDRTGFPGKAIFRRIVLLPLILPGIITGLSLLMFFVAVGMKLSLLTIVLGHGTALISVATTEIFAGLQKLDRAQEEASLDLGANHWRTFLARDSPQSAGIHHCRGAADFHAVHGRNRGQLLPDRPGKHVAAGNMVAPSPRDHPRAQRHLHADPALFHRPDRRVVSASNAHRSRGGSRARAHPTSM
jgi:hypothetical protein